MGYFYLFVYCNVCLILKRKNDIPEIKPIHKLIINIPWAVYAIYIVYLIGYCIIQQEVGNMLPFALMVFGFVALFFYMLFMILILMIYPSKSTD